MAATQMSNRISFKPSAEQLADVQDKTRALQAALQPLLIELGPDDRRLLPKMSTKTVEFVTKTLEHMRANPDLKPGYVDLDEFANDLEAVGQLRSLLAPLQQIVDLLDDSLMLSGSEAYAAALICYQGVKGAARLNMPGAKVVADDLGRQFVGRPARSDQAGATASGPRHPGAAGA
jgi:hypothetical protein